MNKENVCEVKKIVFKIDDKEISLTVEQAKKLKEILGDMFGREIIKEVIEKHIHDYNHYWKYTEPLKPYFEKDKIWCSTSYDAKVQAIDCLIR